MSRRNQSVLSIHSSRLVTTLVLFSLLALHGTAQSPPDDPVQGYSWATVPDKPGVSDPIQHKLGLDTTLSAVANLTVSSNWEVVMPQMEFAQILPPYFETLT
jgi:hypothetical protein